MNDGWKCWIEDLLIAGMHCILYVFAICIERIIWFCVQTMKHAVFSFFEYMTNVDIAFIECNKY